MRDEVKPLYKQAEAVAAAMLRVRPVFVGKQPFPKRAEMMRKALAMKQQRRGGRRASRVVFRREARGELGELLDLLKIEHEDGQLKGPNPPEPDAKVLKSAVDKFKKGENPGPARGHLKAFAAQPAIDWPKLDAMCVRRVTTRRARNRPRPCYARSPCRPRTSIRREDSHGNVISSTDLSFLDELGVRGTSPGASFGGRFDTHGETIASIAPADGSEIGRVKLATRDDYEAVMAKALDAFESWRMRPAPAARRDRDESWARNSGA